MEGQSVMVMYDEDTLVETREGLIHERERGRAESRLSHAKGIVVVVGRSNKVGRCRERSVAPSYHHLSHFLLAFNSNHISKRSLENPSTMKIRWLSGLLLSFHITIHAPFYIKVERTRTHV